MRQFTNKDIVTIKSKVGEIITHIYLGKFLFSKYENLNLITENQSIAIIRAVEQIYPNVSFEPLIQPLQPLIAIARHILADEDKADKRNRTFGRQIRPSFYDYELEEGRFGRIDYREVFDDGF